MIVIRTIRQLSAYVDRASRQGRSIGLVPTMGALHAGHASLIRAARRENDAVIVTVFVNPLQFGPTEGFRRYPRHLPRDVRVARAAGADAVAAPSTGELYPPGFQTAVEPGPLARRWEGERRPGHFRGVCTVVALLFQLARPTRAYFGQKDYQQALIIRRMIQDWHWPLAFRLLPTVREPDGLAMSSRNAFLSRTDRHRATGLFQALQLGAVLLRGGERRAARVERAMRRHVASVGGLRVDYLAVADAETLEPRPVARGRLVLLGAVAAGRTRLIDNVVVEVP